MEMDKDLTVFYDSRYVLKETCAERHASLAKEIGELALAQAKTNTLLGLIAKLMASITVTAVTTAVAFGVNYILK